MTDYDNNLIQLQQKVALKKQLEAKLDDLNKQQRTFEQKVTELHAVHCSEQEDVEKLEKKSLAHYFYGVFGKLDDKITAERREAAAARVKLDAAERELAAVNCELQEIRLQIAELDGCEMAYADALRVKRTELKSSGNPAGTEVLELEEKIAFLESQKREIGQALSAGRNALCAANEALTELESAQDWNTWDMFGGRGMITHMEKHSHLDQAQDHVLALQSKLRKFKTELADINIQADMQVNVDGFLRFADYFFDGLFADFAVGERINESHASVMSVCSKVERAIRKLNSMKELTDDQIAILKAKIEELVIKS